jgi:PTH2 family peptidyl-tRNA hydrolase
MWEMKQVIIARNDLNMSPAKLSVQVAHASFSVIYNNLDRKEEIEKWFDEGLQQKKVVLSGTLKTITKMEKRAIDAGIPYFIVKDAGRTELEPNTTTAIGFFPMIDAEIDKITGNCQLFK